MAFGKPVWAELLRVQMVDVDAAFQQKLDDSLATALDRVVQGCFTRCRVLQIDIGAALRKKSAHLQMALPARVEESRLSESINEIDVYAEFDQGLGKSKPAVTRNIEQTALADVIDEGDLAAFRGKPLRHFDCFELIRAEHGVKNGVLPAFSLDLVLNVEADPDLHLFDSLDVAFGHRGEEVVRDCRVDVQLFLHEVGRKAAGVLRGCIVAIVSVRVDIWTLFVVLFSIGSLDGTFQAFANLPICKRLGVASDDLLNLLRVLVLLIVMHSFERARVYHVQVVIFRA